MHTKLIAAALALLCASAVGSVTAASPVVCQSPNGTLAIEFAPRFGRVSVSCCRASAKAEIA